jgi:hypothetical protein
VADNARISSVESIEAFRAKLIVFLEQMRPVLEEVGNELSRTQSWLQNDQRRFWEMELRRRQRKLDEAKQELFNNSLSQFQTGNAAFSQMAVQRAQHAVREAEAKMGVVKKWDSELENRTAPAAKQIDLLHGFLATDMKRAVAYLDQMLKTLDAYRNVSVSRSEKIVTAEPEKPEGKK